MWKNRKLRNFIISKLSLLISSFVISYMGWYGVLFFSRQLDENAVMLGVFKLLCISIFTAIFAIGFVFIIIDIKEGFINYILKKIIKFANGQS